MVDEPARERCHDLRRDDRERACRPKAGGGQDQAIELAQAAEAEHQRMIMLAREYGRDAYRRRGDIYEMAAVYAEGGVEGARVGPADPAAPDCRAGLAQGPAMDTRHG